MIIGVDIRRDSIQMTYTKEDGTLIQKIEKKIEIKEPDLEKDWICVEKQWKKDHIHPDLVKKVIFVWQSVDIVQMEKIKAKSKEYGFLEGQTLCIAREDAFAHFVLNQEKSLLENTVLMFDFDGVQMMCYSLSHIQSEEQKNQWNIESKDMTEIPVLKEALETKKGMDIVFLGCVKKMFQNERISAVFLMGSGFEGNWMKKSLQFICNGRRTFMGQHLFSDGASYYGKALLENSNTEQILVKAQDMMLYDVGIQIYDGKKQYFHKIISAGKEWYRSKGTVTVIMDRGNRLDLLFKNRITDDVQVETVEIKMFRNRPAKTEKMEISIEFTELKKGVIMVKDLGFGQMFPPTHQVIIKEFTLI